MKVKTGICKKVISSEQYELIIKQELDPKKIRLEDTIREFTNKKGEVIQYLPIRLSYKMVDKEGREYYTLNQETQQYQVSYKVSPVINLYSKEMRIVLELGEYSPLKIVFEEQLKEDKIHYRGVCIQNQTMGKIPLQQE